MYDNWRVGPTSYIVQGIVYTKQGRVYTEQGKVFSVHNTVYSAACSDEQGWG